MAWPIAKCWLCGEWIREGDDYTADRGFYACSDCEPAKERG